MAFLRVILGMVAFAISIKLLAILLAVIGFALKLVWVAIVVGFFVLIGWLIFRLLAPRRAHQV